jgi:hypothetical protein
MVADDELREKSEESRKVERSNSEMVKSERAKPYKVKSVRYKVRCRDRG